MKKKLTLKKFAQNTKTLTNNQKKEIKGGIIIIDAGAI